MGFLLSIATRQCDMLEIFYLSARSFTAKKDCPDLGGRRGPLRRPPRSAPGSRYKGRKKTAYIRLFKKSCHWPRCARIFITRTLKTHFSNIKFNFEFNGEYLVSMQWTVFILQSFYRDTLPRRGRGRMNLHFVLLERVNEMIPDFSWLENSF